MKTREETYCVTATDTCNGGGAFEEGLTLKKALAVASGMRNDDCDWDTIFVKDESRAIAMAVRGGFKIIDDEYDWWARETLSEGEAFDKIQKEGETYNAYDLLSEGEVITVFEGKKLTQEEVKYYSEVCGFVVQVSARKKAIKCKWCGGEKIGSKFPHCDEQYDHVAATAVYMAEMRTLPRENTYEEKETDQCLGCNEDCPSFKDCDRAW